MIIFKMCIRDSATTGLNKIPDSVSDEQALFVGDLSLIHISYAFMCKKFGEQNIAAFVVHMDEANPHVHCTVLPLTEKNRVSFKKIFTKGVNTREALVEYMDCLLYTSASAFVKEPYFCNCA